MKRRNFLLLTTAGAIATMTPFCKSRHSADPADTARPADPAHSPHPPRTPLNTPDFLAAICDSQTIRKIGTDYRTTTTNESREAQLTNLLTTGLDQNKDQTTEIAARIKSDFAAGRTVTIEGYVISVTEARQCALYSIQLP
jgi:hypothetical protein